MHKGRLEAFSDGVLAIIITIMVLELQVPEGEDWNALTPLLHVFLSYALSFVYVGIYWNNHHHLFQVVKEVRGPVLWANLHLLFWLSMIPFVTAWMGENHFAARPVLLYGAMLFMCAIAYTILVQVLLRHHGPDSLLHKAIGRDAKGWASLAVYLVGILLAAFDLPSLAALCYVAVAITWLVPDRRIERVQAAV